MEELKIWMEFICFHALETTIEDLKIFKKQLSFMNSLLLFEKQYKEKNIQMQLSKLHLLLIFIKNYDRIQLLLTITNKLLLSIQRLVKIVIVMKLQIFISKLVKYFLMKVIAKTHLNTLINQYLSLIVLKEKII